MKTICIVLSLFTLLLIIPDNASTRRTPDLKKDLRNLDTATSFYDVRKKLFVDTAISIIGLSDNIASGNLFIPASETRNVKSKKSTEIAITVPPKNVIDLRYVVLILLIGVGPGIFSGKAKAMWNRVSEDEERIK